MMSCAVILVVSCGSLVETLGLWVWWQLYGAHFFFGGREREKMTDFNIITAFDFSCDQNYDEKVMVDLLSGNEGVWV